MRNIVIKKMSLIAIFAALMFVVTAFLQIPLPGGAGYFHFGDVFVFVAAVAIDPLSGGIVGALGGGLADLASGYVNYLPFTIIIKFLLGIIVGYFYRLFKKRRVIGYSGFMLGMIWNAAAYFGVDVLYFTWQAGAINIIPNLVQGLSGAVLGILILELTKDFKLMRMDETSLPKKTSSSSENEKENEKKPD